MKYRAIAISGEASTGKSSIAAALAELLHWDRVNMGARFREETSSHGMTIQQVSTLSDQTHEDFDALQAALLRDARQVVVEGRLSGWLSREFEDVFKVFCYAPLEVRIERYVQREGTSREQARQQILFRDEQDVAKYRKLYGVEDYRDSAYYDLSLDTSTGEPQALARRILEVAGLLEQASPKQA